MLDQQRQIGTALLALGGLFLLLGVLLMFDRALLSLGNLLFLSGFPFLIGFERSLRFFNPLYRKERWRGILLFLGGVALVVFGWPLVGMLVEVVGFVELFGSFLPLVVSFLRQLPYIGDMLTSEYVAPTVDRLAGRRLPV